MFPLRTWFVCLTFSLTPPREQSMEVKTYVQNRAVDSEFSHPKQASDFFFNSSSYHRPFLTILRWFPRTKSRGSGPTLFWFWTSYNIKWLSWRQQAISQPEVGWGDDGTVSNDSRTVALPPSQAGESPHGRGRLREAEDSGMTFSVIFQKKSGSGANASHPDSVDSP